MNNWTTDNEGRLFKIFEFKSYQKSFAFTCQVAMLAEKKNHHPEITLNYSKVEIALISHDVNAITERDRNLANLIDKIYN
tara:strand:+ start:400 stop:639 length:240 start_codon:yes stop_codon:yes gene_type:complete